MKRYILFLILLLSKLNALAQVDTSQVYNLNTPFGALDIRIAKSPSQYYYLQEDKTFSFREANGVRTNTYVDMTAWDSQPYKQGNMREKQPGGDSFVMNYRLLIPQEYKHTTRPGYPLVIIMHGAMERGNCVESKCYHASNEYNPNVNVPRAPASSDHELLNNDYNLVHGGHNYLEAHNINGTTLPDDPSLPAKAYPGFVVFPQNLNGWNASAAEDAIKLVRLLMKKYNIDENRIYINGVSNGGHGAYEAMNRAPWLFAAGVLFSAADDAGVTSQKMVSRIANIPLWIFQGGKDPKPSPKQTQGYINHFRNAGANIRYTLYPQLGHGTWNKAFNEPDFFSWMLNQKKNNIHVFANNPTICKPTGEGAILQLPQGYRAYQWEFNGQLISNEPNATYSAALPGAYRGRFAVQQSNNVLIWNEWSEVLDVTEKNPPPAKVNQTGTVLLTDPNGNGDAILEAEGNYAHYYWFKDGLLLSFPGDQDDTVKIARLKPAYGPGVYYLQASDYDNCKSPPSKAKNVFFNDRAPVNIISPAGLMAENRSPSEVSLSWRDASENEDGFEVWRRRKLDEQNYASWEMAALTDKNITALTDKDLLPSATYQYMIRAISNLGRSQYYPEVTTEPLLITTLPDNEPPSTPIALTASQVAVKTIKLNWKASRDNASIREYYIFYNTDTVATGSNDTTFLLKGIDINTLYTFSVKAVDAGNNFSASSNLVQILTAVSGLYYEHSTGAWNNLSSIDWSIAEFTGIVNDFILSPKTQEDFFNFRFDGYIHIQKDGVYQFRISSNDGSRLSIDDSLIVENDGIHNFTTVTGPIQIMQEGPHRITVDFFDYVKSDSLLVEYKGPDSNNEWVKIPSEVLRSALITSVEPESPEALGCSVYPNPTSSDNITIEYASQSQLPVYISIVGNAGINLYERVVSAAELQNGFRLLDVNKLNTGFYIILIKQNNIIFRKKIIIK